MPQRDTFPNAFEAVFLIFCLFAAELLIGAGLQDAHALLGLTPQEMDGLVTVLANGVLFTGVVQYTGLGYAELFHASSTSRRALVGTLLLPVLCLVPALILSMTSVLLVVQDLFPISVSDQALFERMASGGLASVILASLVAPMVEEMLFRGVILRSFLRLYPRWPAILGSAALFGFAHLNVYQFAVGLVLGTVSGWLYERTRSLWPSIVLHAGYNTALGLAFDDSWLASPTSWLVAFMLAFGSTTLLQRLLPRRA